MSVCREMRKVLNCEVVRLDTKPIIGGGGNTQIIVAWVPYKTVVPTMLFSHGNAVDLGQMLPFYRCNAVMAVLKQFPVNICAQKACATSMCSAHVLTYVSHVLM